MANTTHATLETGDLRLAAILSQEIATLLADRSSMRNSGALAYQGLINGRGSDTIQVRLAGLDGYDKFASSVEDAAVTASAITSSSVNLAISRYTLSRALSDLAELTGQGPGDVNPARLAMSMVGEAEKLFMELVATAIAGFGTDKGTSTVDLSVDDWFDATRHLQENGNTGAAFALLHPTQLSDLQGSLRAEAGALSYVPSSADQIALKGAGYAGMFGGVDIFTNTEVTSSGGNRHGGMWSAGAIGYAEAAPIVAYGDVVRPGGSPLTVEFERSGTEALTSVIGHYYCGVAILQDTMGCGIVTDA